MHTGTRCSSAVKNLDEGGEQCDKMNWIWATTVARNDKEDARG